MRHLDNLYELQNFFLSRINGDYEELYDDEEYLAMLDEIIEYMEEPMEIVCN